MKSREQSVIQKIMLINSIMETYYSRALFLESGINRNGDGVDASFTANSGELSVQGNDKFLKLTLQTLSLLRNFFTINITNNTFWATNGSPFWQEIVIAEGEYPTYVDLGNAISAAIIAANPAWTNVVTFDPFQRIFKIDMTTAGAAWSGYGFVFLCDPANSHTQPVPSEGYATFNDSYLLFGAKPQRDATALALYGLDDLGVSPAFIFYSFYPAMLGTMDEIVVRCQTPGVNMSSYGYDVSTGQANGNNASLTPSNILARIPIRETIFIPATAYTQYIGDGDMTYSMLLGVKNLNLIRIVLTDSRGRSLPQANKDQAKVGNMSFRCSLRLDYMQSVMPQTSRVLVPGDLTPTNPVNFGQE